MAKVKKDNLKHSAFIDHLTLKSTNYIIFGIGILAIIIGYLVMASGDTNSFRSLSLAPIILLIGYLIIIPVAILYRKKENSESSPEK
jgi:general stress protein CsbA